MPITQPLSAYTNSGFIRFHLIVKTSRKLSKFQRLKASLGWRAVWGGWGWDGRHQEGERSPWVQSPHPSRVRAAGILQGASRAQLWSQFHFQIWVETDGHALSSSWRGGCWEWKGGKTHQIGWTNSFPRCLQIGIGYKGLAASGVSLRSTPSLAQTTTLNSGCKYLNIQSTLVSCLLLSEQLSSWKTQMSSHVCHNDSTCRILS